MRKLSYHDVRVRRPLAWDVFDEFGTLLLCKGYVIESRSQMHGLIERGLYVDADRLTGPAAAGHETRCDPFWLWDDIHSKLVRVLRASTPKTWSRTS